MSFGLLSPLFLTGLAAMAIPVLVHLVQREERASVRFPSLMFLRRIPTREHRRRSIRHWALLILRCLVIVGLCLAFAAPFIELPDVAVGKETDNRQRVVVLDRSYSMGLEGRWQDAIGLAREAVEELDAGDGGALILFDHETQVANGLSDDLASLAAGLADIEPGAGHTDVTGALERAGEILSDSDAVEREIVIISDFQRTGHVPGNRPRLPPDIMVVPRIVAEGDRRNALLAAVKVNRERRGSDDAVRLRARVVNAGPTHMDDVGVTLEVDGRDIEQHFVALPPGGSAEVGFRLVAAGDDLTRVRVYLGSDALAADNDRHLVLTSAPALSVLILRHTVSRPEQNLFLEQALHQGSLPEFRVTSRTLDELREEDFDDADVVVINDAPIPGARMGERLRSFLDAGGGLLVVAAERVHGNWPNGDQGIVPGELGRLVDRTGPSPARLVNLDTTHPVLGAFAHAEGGDLNGARVYRYRTLNDVAGDSVIARYDDGAVALAERRVGRGRVLVVTTTLDPAWNTLPLEPGFLPFTHRALEFLGAHTTTPHAFTVGDSVDLARYARALPGYDGSVTALTRGTVTSVRTPSGARLRLGSGESLIAVRESGFYEAHVSGGGTRSLTFAANVETRESNLEPLDVEDYLTAIDTAPSPRTRPASAQADDADPKQTRQAWWLILLICTSLLLAETLFSNRLSPRVGPS